MKDLFEIFEFGGYTICIQELFDGSWQVSGQGIIREFSAYEKARNYFENWKKDIKSLLV